MRVTNDMTFSISLATIAISSAVILVVVLLIAMAARMLRENRRRREEHTEAAARMPDAVHQPEVEKASHAPEGAYSYGAIVMDEVVGEKIIEGLKESLRMTEEMYKKLSERFSDDRERRIELANDWLNYLEAVDNIKQLRIDYHMNSADGDSMRTERESTRVKLEVENKFRTLLQSSSLPQPSSTQ